MSKCVDNEFHTLRGYQLKEKNDTKLTPALEDYLEMVYRLCLEQQSTRINKLSKSLNVRPSSASKMVSKLVELGLLKYDKLDCILLTNQGKSIGKYLLERHHIVESFFKLIGSNSPLKEAELVEHMLCPSTVYRIKALIDFFDKNPIILENFYLFIKLDNVTYS